MSFAAVVEQEAGVRALESRLARTGGSGSTLILGPEGVGRFLLARCAAKAILGEETLVEAGRHPDLTILEPEAGIDGVRDAVKALQRRPAQGPRQVLIVRDADRLGVEAHNALLKTLEEPPADAAVLLVAGDPALLPETVVSRCVVVHARPLTDAGTARVLAGLGQPEDAAADAGGAPGRALFQLRHGVVADAERLLGIVLRRQEDPLATAAKLAKRPADEKTRGQRIRLAEVLRVAADRLRRELPATENALRCVVEALGSLVANANPAVILAELALTPWRTKETPRP